MSTVTGATKMTCPKCKQTDVTTFQTCRNCGTRYDFTPQVKKKEVAIGMPLFLTIIFVAAGICIYQFYQIQATYAHPERLIGKTMQCQQSQVLAAITPDDLFRFDSELAKAQKKDPKKYGSKGIGGVLAAASALNSMASGEETSYTIMFRYLQSGQVRSVSSDSAALLSVAVIGAKTSAGQFYRSSQTGERTEGWYSLVDELQRP